MIAALTQTERDGALSTLPKWSYDADRKALFRKIVVGDFFDALGLMVRIGLEAEKACHHPEWFNVYNRIDIWLTTHDADGVSSRDVALAAAIDGLAER